MADEKRRRAQEAEFILGSEVFQEAWNALDALYVAQWRTAQEARDRELAWHRQKILGEVRQQLVSLVTQQKLANRRNNG